MVIRRYSQRFISAFKHAFSTNNQKESFSLEEMALMEKIAATVVERGMSIPAIIFLESIGPINFIGSQALHSFSPIFGLVCNAEEMEKMAEILEKRSSISTLITMIESKEKGLSTSHRVKWRNEK